MMYECKLTNDGIVQELFYREAENASDMEDRLNMFEWPEGKWTITRVESEDEDED